MGCRKSALSWMFMFEVMRYLLVLKRSFYRLNNNSSTYFIQCGIVELCHKQPIKGHVSNLTSLLLIIFSQSYKNFISVVI